MPSGYGGSSDDVSQRCRLATTALVDLTVKFGGRAAWYRHCAPGSASACSCALASRWGRRIRQVEDRKGRARRDLQ